MIKIKEINILRGFAILGVISIHVTAVFTNSEVNSLLTKVAAIIDVYSHYAVPLFILLSGLVLGMNYVDNYNLKEFYIKRFNKIFIPYTIFSLFYLPLRFHIHNIESISLIKLTIWFLSASTFYHLWFFLLIFQLYIFYPIIRKVITNKSTYFLALIFCIQTIYSYINGYLFENKYLDFIANRLFFSYIFYFSLGIWIADNFDKVKNTLKKINWKAHVIFIGISIILSIIFSYNWLVRYNNFYSRKLFLIFLENFISPIMYILIFIYFFKFANLLVSSEGIVNLFINKLGKYSFGIYLIHAGFLVIIQNILELSGLYIGNISYYIFSFLLTLFSSLFFCYLINKYRYSKFIIGI